MPRVPWWGLVSSLAAPVLLIGGWTVAAGVQPVPFNAVVQTISDLAARDTPDRLLMTSALFGVGVSHLVTACALVSAARVGRAVYALGALATILVGAFPLPGEVAPRRHTPPPQQSRLSRWPCGRRSRASAYSLRDPVRPHS